LSHVLRPTGRSYDDKGSLARMGKLDHALLEALNGLNFYQLPFPKSLSYEWFCKAIVPILDQHELSLEDTLNTCIHHIASQISKALIPFGTGKSQMLVTGGGAKNDFLVETLSDYLENAITVKVPHEQLVDFKEALIFAFMGVLRNREEKNCLKSVTGASQDSCGGVIYSSFN
jgi:anhydro-N-acetylmuramic acid kinase